MISQKSILQLGYRILPKLHFCYNQNFVPQAWEKLLSLKVKIVLIFHLPEFLIGSRGAPLLVRKNAHLCILGKIDCGKVAVTSRNLEI